jgi:hypothetical protein
VIPFQAEEKDGRNDGAKDSVGWKEIAQSSSATAEKVKVRNHKRCTAWAELWEQRRWREKDEKRRSIGSDRRQGRKTNVAIIGE